MGIYRQKSSKSSKNDFRLRFAGPGVDDQLLEAADARQFLRKGISEYD